MNTEWICSICGKRIKFASNIRDDIQPSAICRMPQLDTDESTNYNERIIYEGVGTQLAKILNRVGIEYDPGCSCSSKVSLLDKKGLKWCTENQDYIINILSEEAIKRNIPIVPKTFRALVRLAIFNVNKSLLVLLNHPDKNQTLHQ